MEVREAVFADAGGIAKVHVDSWRETYKDIIPDSFLEKLSYEQRETLWESNISGNTNSIFVAENKAGNIIGFTSIGKRPSNTEDHVGDLTSIYLLKSYQGKRIGKQLLQKAILKSKELGYKKIFVEVLEENRSRYFYQHYGAKLQASKKITIGGAELELLIYEWGDVDEVISLLS